MLRSLSIAAAGTGAAALLVIACSSSVDPTTATFRTPAQVSNDEPILTPQQSGTTQRFFAVSPVNSRVVWASAAGGTYALTTDGGETWSHCGLAATRNIGRVRVHPADPDLVFPGDEVRLPPLPLTPGA